MQLITRGVLIAGALGVILGPDHLAWAQPSTPVVFEQEVLATESAGSSSTSEQAPREFKSYTPENVPLGNSYPITTSQADKETDQPARSDQHQFYSYLFSAYIPPLDQTEVNLALLLSEAPGMEASVGWGAAPDLMMAAKMTVAGTSYATGIKIRYNLRTETSAENKPAIAADLGWRFANHRTRDSLRENIFRGNRFFGGVIISKSLGSLARSLEAKASLQTFMETLTVNLEPLVEIQSGRVNAAEDAMIRLEVGMRMALEISLEPNVWYALVMYDSQPEFIGTENYFLGGRYVAHSDFAVDLLLGEIYSHITLQIGVAWIF